MNKFKPGDKLRVVKWENSSDKLEEGQVVEVESVNTEFANYTRVDLKGIETWAGWNEDRFELVTPSIDLTKPVETLCGKPVTIVLTDGRGPFPVKGYIGDTSDLSSWTLEGGYYTQRSSASDLRNVAPKPAEREVYVNVHKNADGTLEMAASKFDTARGAAFFGQGRVGCIKVKLVEGQWDN